MKYIFINPVIRSMYDSTELNDFVASAGYRQIYCEKDWADIVKKKYSAALQEADGPLVDERCPLAVEELKKKQIPGLVYAEILPILLHSAIEISENTAYQKGQKLIISPCESLAVQGRTLHLPDMEFETWRTFLRRAKQAGMLPPPFHRLKESPVPPGFFHGLCSKIQMLTGSAFREQKPVIEPDTQLIEMLYCENGCHNGEELCP